MANYYDDWNQMSDSDRRDLADGRFAASWYPDMEEERDKEHEEKKSSEEPKESKSEPSSGNDQERRSFSQ